MLKAATITSKCATHILKSFNHLPVHKTPPSLGNKRDVSQTKKVKVHFKYILPKDVSVILSISYHAWVCSRDFY